MRPSISSFLGKRVNLVLFRRDPVILFHIKPSSQLFWLFFFQMHNEVLARESEITRFSCDLSLNCHDHCKQSSQNEQAIY